MKYTPDEIAALLANRPNQPHYVEALIGKCVKAAVLAEREACARMADLASAESAQTYSACLKNAEAAPALVAAGAKAQSERLSMAIRARGVS